MRCRTRYTPGTALHLIWPNLKYMTPHGAHNDDTTIRMPMANRCKQLAKAIWLSQHIEAILSTGEPVILAVDLNDDSGLDDFAGLFGQPSMEILLSDNTYDPHARKILNRCLGGFSTAERFRLQDKSRYFQAL